MSGDLLRPSTFLKNTSRWLLESDLCFVYSNEFPVIEKHTQMPKGGCCLAFDNLPHYYK